ncbi:DsbA family protein [Demequina lutea]|uniref:Protein-disulfide isomerase n=1 Tax=Demequina lutea TaxID=431489 RepID=A0A7Y9ZA97_9MICO|nr:thioredoxin domain-containing protein [Demequina lutea]NYI40553.1 protein-disulfide isomerase [Demequina lutea]
MNDKTAANAAATLAKRQAQAQVDAQKRRAAVIWIVVGVIVVGLIGTLVAFIVRQGAVADVSVAGPSGAPVVSNTDGFGVGSSGVVGKDLDPSRVRLDVYFDFICPYCALFEKTQAATLDDLRSQGIVDVYYHPLAYLDDASSGTKYSTRAASAAALVAQESPESFVAFLQQLMEHQPAEGSTGLPDQQIQSLASAAGVPDAIVAKIPDQGYAAWVRSSTEAANKDGVMYTPSLGFSGVIQDPTDPASVQWSQEGALRQAIMERAAG